VTKMTFEQPLVRRIRGDVAIEGEAKGVFLEMPPVQVWRFW
jgi:hypothetical protein